MKEQKTNSFKNCCTFFLYAFLLLSTFLVFDCTGIVRFASGYYLGNLIYITLLYGLIFMCCISALIISIVNLSKSWTRKEERAKRNFRIRAGILFIVIIYISVNLFVSALFIGSDLINEPFHKGFYSRVSRDINIDQVRDWLANLDEETFNKWSHGFRPEKTDPINIPEDIFGFRPSISYMTLYEDEQGCKCVDLEWGGPFDRWGIVIGPKEMTVPSSDTEYDGRYRYKVEDGAYSWGQIE